MLYKYLNNYKKSGHRVLFPLFREWQCTCIQYKSCPSVRAPLLWRFWVALVQPFSPHSSLLFHVASVFLHQVRVQVIRPISRSRLRVRLGGISRSAMCAPGGLLPLRPVSRCPSWQLCSVSEVACPPASFLLHPFPIPLLPLPIFSAWGCFILLSSPFLIRLSFRPFFFLSLSFFLCSWVAFFFLHTSRLSSLILLISTAPGGFTNSFSAPLEAEGPPHFLV